MPVFYCGNQAHKAFTTSKQWSSHWNFTHKGEERPSEETATIDEADLPEGVVLAPPPAGKQPAAQPDGPEEPAKPQRKAAKPAGRAAPDDDPPDIPEGAAKLDRVLIAIGASPQARATITAGWQTFTGLQTDPRNFDQYVRTYLDAKLQPQIPLVMNEMFPNAPAQPPPYPAYYFGGGAPPPPGYGGGYQFGAPPYYPAPPYPGAPAYGAPPYYPAPTWEPRRRPAQEEEEEEQPRRRGRNEPDPAVQALSEQLAVMSDNLAALQGQMAQDKAEQARKAEQDAQNQRFTQMETRFNELVELVRAGRTAEATTGAAAREVALAQQLDTLRLDLQTSREESHKTQVASLEGRLSDLSQEVTNLRNNPAVQTGKTTEDLVASVLPEALARVEGMGKDVVSELKGIRTQVGEGRLPQIGPPGGGLDPKRLQQRLALENQLLNANQH